MKWNQPCKVPVSALFLVGLCPALAACDSFWNALLISAATVLVFTLTFGVVYLLRDVISGAVRTVVLLLTAATLAGVACLLTEAYFPALYASVGLYLPLTALECVALDRVLVGQDAGPLSLARPGMCAVFTLLVAGLLREFLGAGTLFGVSVLPSYMEVPALFHSVPGAFLTLAFVLIAVEAGGHASSRSGEEASK